MLTPGASTGPITAGCDAYAAMEEVGCFEPDYACDKERKCSAYAREVLIKCTVPDNIATVKEHGAKCNAVAHGAAATCTSTGGGGRHCPQHALAVLACCEPGVPAHVLWGRVLRALAAYVPLPRLLLPAHTGQADEKRCYTPKKQAYEPAKRVKSTLSACALQCNAQPDKVYTVAIITRAGCFCAKVGA